MGAPLRVLLIEDSEADALLLLRELRRGGYDPASERVDTAAALNAALTRQQWDLITCDWVMPQFSAPAALQLIKRSGCDVPIIIVSGEVGEEIAVSAMKAGAHDYVGKHKLARLVPAIERELREAENRRARTRAAAALSASEHRVHQQLAEIEHIYRTTPVGICFLDCNLRYVRINERLAAMNGQPIEAHLGRTIHEIIPEFAVSVGEACRRALERREPQVDVEARGPSPANPSEQGVFLCSYYPVNAEDGSLLGLNVLVVDVTERKRAESLLRASEERYRTLVETSHDLIWSVDAQGRYTFVNRAVRQLYGYEPEEMLGHPFTDFLSPEDQRRALQALESIAIEGHKFGFECEALRKDGRAVVHQANATAVRDVHGDLIGVRGTTTDITERVRAQEALQRSERHFRSLIENAADLIAIIGPDGTVRYVSPSHTRVLGYQPEEIVGRSAFDFVHPDDVALVLETFQHAVLETETTASAEFRFRHLDGSWCHLEGVAKNALDNPVVAGIIVNSRDITARKRAEEALRLARDHLRTYIDQANDLIFMLNPRGKITSVNRAVSDTTGYSAEELLGAAPLEVLVPETRAIVAAALGRAVLGGRIEPVEIEIVAKDGRRITLEVRGRTIWEGDHVVEMFCIARDITERRRAEEERARLSAAVEQAGESVLITDVTGTILYVNPATERLTGYGRDELIGQNARLLRSDRRDVEAFQPLVAAATRGEVWSGYDIQRRKDGSLYEIEVTVSPIHDAAGRTINYVGIGRDVTRERQAEAELRQAQKLEAIGRLAGGVAHDFNNQLTIIKGCAQFLLSGLPPDDQRYQDAHRINETVDRGARLVRQLLTFSRLGPVETQSVNLTDLITELAPMLRLLLGEQMLMRVHCAPDLWPVRVDRSQVEQVLMNLVGNARDAMAPSGEATSGQMVSIEVANVELDQWAHGLPKGVRPGHYVALVVSDNGPGMPVEVQAHVFEPFFTTKGFGKGTGLGLATVYGIVKQHGGYIACISELGRGTRFEIYFPRADRAPRPAEEPGQTALQDHAPIPQEWTVLVVEDDESVREVLVRALEESGYQAYGAAKSDDALAVAEHVNGQIDLLVTDIVMPGCNGYALARRLMQTRPDLRVLFVSGYYVDPLDLLDAPGARVLLKPFGLDELLQTVAEMLAGAAPARPALEG